MAPLLLKPKAQFIPWRCLRRLQRLNLFRAVSPTGISSYNSRPAPTPASACWPPPTSRRGQTSAGASPARTDCFHFKTPTPPNSLNDFTARIGRCRKKFSRPHRVLQFYFPPHETKSLRRRRRRLPGSRGTSDNSPAFQRRVKSGIAKVPQGRLNNVMSYISSYFHCVFSTKERRPFITPELRERLWPFLGGIARQNKMN